MAKKRDIVVQSTIIFNLESLVRVSFDGLDIGQTAAAYNLFLRASQAGTVGDATEEASIIPPSFSSV